MASTSDTPGDRTWYGATAALTLSLVAWLIAVPDDHPVAYLVGIDVLAALVVLAAARSARVGLAVRRAAVILAGAFAFIAVSHIEFPEVAHDATVLLVLVVGSVVPVIVARDVIRRRSVDAHLVFGAITIYLLLGIASAMVIALAATVVSAPMLAFDGTRDDGTFRDQVYFSFVTLSTTGYGDVIPGNPITRAIAILTALIGQLYLVTAVATAVSLFSAITNDEFVTMKRKALG